MCFELWRDDDAEGATCVSRGDTRPSLDWSYVTLMTGSLISLWSLRKAGKSSTGDGTFVDAVEGCIESVNSYDVKVMLEILPRRGSQAQG